MDTPESCKAYKSRSQREVLAELLDSGRAKSEHEHVAARVIARLIEALKECADDLDVCVEQEYAPLRGYASYERKRQRDLGPVREARELIELYRYQP